MEINKIKEVLDLIEDKIEKIGSKFGIASSNIFPYFVRYCVSEALICLITSIIFIFSISVALISVFLFVPKTYNPLAPSLRELLIFLGYAAVCGGIVNLCHSIYKFAIVYTNKEISAWEKIKDNF